MLVQDETQWRVRPAATMRSDGRQLKVAISRWRSQEDAVVDVCSDGSDDSHVLTLVQRRVRQELQIAGRSVWTGGEEPDAMLLTGPRSARWRAIVHGRHDNLRIFLSQDLLRECVAETSGRHTSDAIRLFEAEPVEDESLRQLALAFKAADVYDGLAGPCFLEGLALAFATRLVELHHHRPMTARPVAKLAAGDLGRIVDYVEAHLGDPIYLAELSHLVNLPRMRFAKQFKAATSHSPYAYILRRRITRAQHLLRHTQQPIVDVALELGFSSQGHFAATFRRIVGTSPGAWRRLGPPAG